MSGPIKFDSGLTGMHKGLDGIQKAASNIASKDAMEADGQQELAAAMVDLEIYSHQVEASAPVVKITDQIFGTLLDIMA